MRGGPEGGWGRATEAGHLFTETSPRPLRCVQNPSTLSPDPRPAGAKATRDPSIRAQVQRAPGPMQEMHHKHLLSHSSCFTEREKEAHQKVSYVHIVRQRPSQYLKHPSPAARWL